MKRKWLFLLLSMVLLTVVLAGCGSGDDEETDDSVKLEELNESDTFTLDVMYANEQAFMEDYGILFSTKYPNVEYNVISTLPIFTADDPKEEFQKIVEEQKPDIFALSSDQYEQLIEEGRLLELDSLITKDNFDTEGISSGVLDLLKEPGNGTLYGLSPTFNSFAIFYNKNLFDENNVAYPQDQMTWQEVIELAQQFENNQSGEDKIYGFYAENPALGGAGNLMLSIGTTEELIIMDAEDSVVNMNTPEWKEVLELTIDAYEGEAFYKKGDTETDFSDPMSIFTSDKFLMGKSAMTVQFDYYFNFMEQAGTLVDDAATFDWDIATYPVDELNRDVATGFSLGEVYAINADSDNVSAAWEFMKFVNDENMANLKSKSSSALLSRTDYIPNEEGKNMEALYKLQPTQSAEDGINNLGYEDILAFTAILDEEATAAVNEDKTVEEALESMEQRVQELVNEAKQKEEDEQTEE